MRTGFVRPGRRFQRAFLYTNLVLQALLALYGAHPVLHVIFGLVAAGGSIRLAQGGALGDRRRWLSVFAMALLAGLAAPAFLVDELRPLAYALVAMQVVALVAPLRAWWHERRADVA